MGYDLGDIQKMTKALDRRSPKTRVYKSKTFDTKIAAQTWAIETEQFLSSEVDLVRGKTFANALDRFEREVSKGRKGERWKGIRINKHRRDALADRLLEDLTMEDINRWIVEQTTSASTINRDLNLLSSVFSHCIKWKWIKQNPCKGCQRPRQPGRRGNAGFQNMKSTGYWPRCISMRIGA